MGSGQAAIEVDTIGSDAQFRERSLLGGQIPTVRRAASMADQDPGHGKMHD